MVSVYDHGYLYGIGLFETFRSYGGKAFLLREHLDRLLQGCRSLGIVYEPDEKEIDSIVLRLLEVNHLEDGYFRLSVSAGREELGLTVKPYESPQIVLYVKPLPPSAARGRPLQLLQLRRNTPEGTVREKSFHYMNNILAKRELVRYPWAAAASAEGMLLNGDGYLAEGIVSNLFFVKDGVMHTPAVGTGILPGITRAYIMKLVSDEGWLCREGYYTWENLWQADEAFFTSSIQEIVPVTRLFDLDGTVRDLCPDGLPTSYTKRLQDRYWIGTSKHQV